MVRGIKAVKLEDLAKKLKVSKVTVSKALRNHPDISEETKVRVRELADKYGYVPNFMAKNLSARKSNIIGLVIPKIAHFFFGSIIESIYNTAFENNYETVITVSQESAEREKKHLQSLLSMRVDGLIISITEQTKDCSMFEKIIESKIPLVFIDRVPPIKNVPSVTVNDKGGAFSAVNYFIKNGITEIGHVGGYSHINIGKARMDGFIDAMQKSKVPINPNWVVEGGFGEEDGYKGFKTIFNSGSLPKAIFAITYPVAIGIYEAATELGIKIPQDIQITCFGNNTFKHTVPSVFNFVDQPTLELGKHAVQLLLDIINNTYTVPRNIELNTRLLIKGKESLSGLVA
ncbi:MAG: LacI family DNA-binding transcriptional regulator [Ignavibacteriaceae bacterium]|nr:LacI family DNA-binding transcriptional regulator [Ignavibacteriaceae bacterium]